MVSITPIPPHYPSFVMPSTGELTKLSCIVYRQRPDLDPSRDRDQRHLRAAHEFAVTFRMLGAMGRTEQVDHGKALSYWCDVVREGLSAYYGIFAEVPANILLAAALAHGDVKYARNGLGLRWWEAGIPAGEAWRTVLKTEQLLPPSPEPSAAQRPPGRVTIVDLNQVRPDYVGLVGTEVR